MKSYITVVLSTIYTILLIGLPLGKLTGMFSISWGIALCPLWIPLLIMWGIACIISLGILIFVLREH